MVGTDAPIYIHVQFKNQVLSQLCMLKTWRSSQILTVAEPTSLVFFV